MSEICEVCRREKVEGGGIWNPSKCDPDMDAEHWRKGYERLQREKLTLADAKALAMEARQESLRIVLTEAAKAQQGASDITYAMASESGRGRDIDAHLMPIAEAILAAEERGRLWKEKEMETLRGALALANDEIRRLVAAASEVEERGRRKGVEAAKELSGAAECLLRFRDPWDSASRSDWQRYREALARIEDLELRTFAPRDSGPQTQCKHGKPGVKCDRCPWCWSVKCPGTEVPRDPGKEGCK